MTDRQRGRDDAGGAREGREGFGDDGGTRVGRPDPAKGADVSTGPSSQPVKEGLEGAVFEEEEDGAENPNARNASGRGRPTGAGSEAAEGTHDAMHGQGPSSRTSADQAAGGTAGDDARRGSEPLTGREREHESGYGGRGGSPRTSSDQRE